MDKKEKLLKKIGKLLTSYGVTEEEKAKFMADLEDGEANDQEELNSEEEVVEEKVENEEVPPMESEEESADESPVDETKVEGEGEGDTEIPSGDEELPPSDEPNPAIEEPADVPPTEDEMPSEVPPMEAPVDVDYNARIEELQKTNDALSSRLSSLEEALTKAGVLVGAMNEQPIGLEHQEPSSSQATSNGLEDVLKRLNK